MGSDSCLPAGDVDNPPIDGIVQGYGRGFCGLDNTSHYIHNSGGLRQVSQVRKLLSHARHDSTHSAQVSSLPTSHQRGQKIMLFPLFDDFFTITA
jgi:hypothetical protein